VLETIDLTQALTDEEYDRQKTAFQVRLMKLSTEVYFQKRPVVMAFEGWDAGGKGGAIRRLTERIDPRGYVVYPIAAPKGDDAERHYLWRFWRRLPERGQIAIFDRTWYGRVLVERIEGFATEEEWRRAYQEINQFERELVDFGTVVLKFWLHISAEEQLARFQARENTPYKSWKLTDEDWRNREKWNLYAEAVEDMLQRTSTTYAPWTIVEANDKYFARVKVLRTVVETLENELDLPKDFYEDVPLPRKVAAAKNGKDKKKKTKKKKKSRKK
jgi:polyphosphate kinase 2 (PPK2 family)